MPKPKEEDQDKSKKTSLGEAIKRKFLEERKIFFWGEVNDESCQKAVEQVLYLEMMDPGKEITFYLNSPGGSTTAGLALFDTMKAITSPIKIVVMGMAASMGSILLCAGKKGSRFIFPHARVLIHQPLIMGKIVAPAIDINIHAQEIEKQREELNKILAEASGQSMDKIRKDSDRDFYMNAQDSIDYGLVDGIITEM